MIKVSLKERFEGGHWDRLPEISWQGGFAELRGRAATALSPLVTRQVLGHPRRVLLEDLRQRSGS